MPTNIPPMPEGRPPEEAPHVTHQHAAPSTQHGHHVPPEQKLVYATTPPAEPEQPSWASTAGPPLWTEPPGRAKQPQRSPWIFGIGGLVVGLALGLVVGLVAIPAIGSGIATRAEAAAPNPFEVALDDCDMADSAYATIGDDGASLELQTFGDEAVGMDLDELTCITEALDISDAVLSRIETTRALDGRQEASWGDFTASWTYHPDNGLNMLIEHAPHDES